MSILDKIRKKEDSKMKVDKDGNPIKDDDNKNKDQNGLVIPEGHVLLPASELENMQKRLDAFDRGGFADTRNVQPPPPSGPTIKEQIAEIDTEIEKLDTQIDKAIIDGKGISTLNRQRDALNAKKNKIYTDEQVNRVANQGVEVITQLSSQVMEGQMPYLNLVREDYDRALNSMSPEARMNPAIQKKAYEMAVGANIDKVTAASREELLRGGDEIIVNDSTFVRKDTIKTPTDDRDPNLPTFEQHFGADAMQALRVKGISPDQYARTLGYESADEYIKADIEITNQIEGGAAQ